MDDDPDRPALDALIAARDPLYAGLPLVFRAATLAGHGAQERESIDAALGYLDGVLLAHCHAERFTLFPAIDGIIGAPGATAPMASQHDSLAAMVSDLREVVSRLRDGGDAARLQPAQTALLYGIYAAIRVHIEAEDDAWLPLIQEHLSASQVSTLVENLTRIVGNVPPTALADRSEK